MKADAARIREEAARLGFDDCRITTARPPESGGHYRRWLASGCHGEMGWMERSRRKRLDPSLVLADVRSIIVLAASYHHPGAPPSAASSGGVVARYARHDDYHAVLGERLRRLCALAAAPEGERALWYVDTGPVLERDLAQRAGLGFIGKHTNLISRSLGNWFFLSEILTTRELDPDPPQRNHCGKCTRCLSACPTGAIPEPFVLDARRCISYLTIELKGAIPEELRPAIGNRIFGCDDCLAVCPWNRFAREGRIMRTCHREEFARVSLEEWAAIGPDEFRSRFRPTPLYRTGWRRLLRNVCVALGNTGDDSHLPVLRRLAGSGEPLVAEHALWAIGRIRYRRIQSTTASGSLRAPKASGSGSTA